MQLELKHTFDDNTFRHSLNGHEFVLHCHHYMTLATKMAEDFADLGGPKILREVAEDTIRPVLDSYFRDHSVGTPADRLDIARQYFAAMGLGLMEITGDAGGGEIKLPHSHVDEGWLKKFGPHDSPVNHFTCGFAAAVFAATFDKPARSYQVVEKASLVTGAPATLLAVAAS